MESFTRAEACDKWKHTYQEKHGSVRRIRVSDDEGYNNRCNESTSQDLVDSDLYERTTQGGEAYQRDDSKIKPTTGTDNQPINNEQGTETESRGQKHERMAKT